MSVNKGPIIDPGLCRCCGKIKRCRIINEEYGWCGQKEVYSDMILDCFGLLLSHLDGDTFERLICATCVGSLRNAIEFRHQVLKCEESLLKSKLIDNKELKLNFELDIKEERDDNLDHEDCNDVLTEDQDYDQRKRQLMRLVKKKHNDTEKKSLDNGVLNVITLVENSYLCPFVTVYSDYYCLYCREIFLEPDGLIEHTFTHDPVTFRHHIDGKKRIFVDIQRLECRLCSTKLNKIDELMLHLTKEHDKVFFEQDENKLLMFILKTGKMECTQCDKIFPYFQALKRHMAVHYGTWVCDKCAAHYFEERHLLEHKKQRHKSENEKIETYCCEYCGKNFKTDKGRFFHIAKIHRNEPAYHCNKCDQVFHSHHWRIKHKMEKHGEVRKFVCETCDKVYDTRKSLREHTRSKHLMLLKHECQHCDKNFYLPSQLKDHMTSHTGEKRFRCETCGKCYSRLKALKVHKESHNDEKKYKCTLCPSAYTQQNNYKNHIKSKHQAVGGQFLSV